VTVDLLHICPSTAIDIKVSVGGGVTAMVKKVITLLLMMAVFGGSFNIGNSQESLMNKIVINIPSRTLTYYDGISSKIYPVAVGKANTRTPTGSFTIQNKVVNPYYSKKKIPGGRADNPLGIRWMGFKGNYGIHGNSAPNSIGTIASAGCVRMFNYDVKELYEKVTHKTPVEVTYNLFQVLEQDRTKEKMLMVYPDVYKRERYLKEAIKNHLDAAGLKSERTWSKIDGAVKLTKDQMLVIGEKWVLIINQQHVTTEIIKDSSKFYIGEDVLNDYFGLILDRTVEGYLSIQNTPVEYRIFDSRCYVSLESIQQILGGSITVDDTVENLWYDVSFVKLNGTFLETNHSKIATHRPMIPVRTLSSIVLPIESIGSNVEIIENVEHMEIEEAQSLFGFRYDMNSIEKKVELFIKPTVAFEPNSQVPEEIFDHVDAWLKSMDFHDISAFETVHLMENVSDQYEILWNPYKTKLSLKIKEAQKTESINEVETSIVLRKK
jgi:hypothetical protein